MLKGHKYGFLKVKGTSSAPLQAFEGYRRFSDQKAILKDQTDLSAINVFEVAYAQSPLTPRPASVPTAEKSQLQLQSKDTKQGRDAKLLEEDSKVKVAREVLLWLMHDTRTEWGNSVQLMKRPPKLKLKDRDGTRSENSPKKIPRPRDKNGYFVVP